MVPGGHATAQMSRLQRACRGHVQATNERGSLQINRPVSGVDETLPAGIFRIAEFDRQEGASLGADWFADQFQSCFTWRAPTFAHVALHA